MDVGAGLSGILTKENLAYLKERVQEKFIAKGVWRIKNNDEVYSLYKEPSIMKMIKIAKIEMIRTHSKDGE